MPIVKKHYQWRKSKRKLSNDKYFNEDLIMECLSYDQKETFDPLLFKKCPQRIESNNFVIVKTFYPWAAMVDTHLVSIHNILK